jgi:hypothetical protein
MPLDLRPAAGRRLSGARGQSFYASSTEKRPEAEAFSRRKTFSIFAVFQIAFD